MTEGRMVGRNNKNPLESNEKGGREQEGFAN